MRDLIVYVLIALLYKVESRTLCSDQRCVCSNKENSLQILCSSHPTVLSGNYNLPDTVRILNLSRNNLTRIQRSPSLASETLKELSLAYNQINELSIDAFRLPSLERLDLRHNELEFIHRDTFALMTKLNYINLANNRFSAFGNLNFYHLKGLRHIVLDNNDIGPSLETHSLYEGGYELTNDTQCISLRNINLKSDNKYIFVNGTDKLRNLTISQNSLTTIPNLPPNLEYLDISNNPIEEISGNIFLFSIYLRELKLNNILIQEVPDFAFFYLTSLVNVELAGNTRLKKFSPLAWGRVILKDQIDLFVENLTLRGANLTSLDSKMEGIFKKIKNVDLRDNPWKCDCKISWLQNIKIPDDFADFRCFTPQRLLNRRILELNSTVFLCEEPTLPSEDYFKTAINVTVYCTLLLITVLMMYFFIFSPKPFMYRQLPVEFPHTP